MRDLYKITTLAPEMTPAIEADANWHSDLKDTTGLSILKTADTAHEVSPAVKTEPTAETIQSGKLLCK